MDAADKALLPATFKAMEDLMQAWPWEVDEAANPMVQLGKDSQHISPIRVGLEAESL